MEFQLNLPIDALTLESFLHKICDHYGFSDAKISTNGNHLIISYPENYSFNRTPAIERHADSVPGLQC